LEDAVFVVTILTEPATVTVNSGGNVHVFEAPAGASAFTVSMGVGSQAFSISRNDQVIQSGVSLRPILDGCVCGLYNFNPYGTCTPIHSAQPQLTAVQWELYHRARLTPYKVTVMVPLLKACVSRPAHQLHLLVSAPRLLHQDGETLLLRPARPQAQPVPAKLPPLQILQQPQQQPEPLSLPIQRALPALALETTSVSATSPVTTATVLLAFAPAPSLALPFPPRPQPAPNACRSTAWMSRTLVCAALPATTDIFRQLLAELFSWLQGIYIVGLGWQRWGNRSFGHYFSLHTVLSLLLCSPMW
jgi:hypothetical protein